MYKSTTYRTAVQQVRNISQNATACRATNSQQIKQMEFDL